MGQDAQLGATTVRRGENAAKNEGRSCEDQKTEHNTP